MNFEDCALSRRAVVSAVGGVGVAAVLWPGVTPAEASAKAQPPAPAKTRQQRVVRGGVRQYARPTIAPGHRLVLPAGTTILAGGVAGAPTAWPYAFRDGHVVDLGEMAPIGSATQAVVLSVPPASGWYEIRDQYGVLTDRRTWNARQMSHLRLNQEWGATQGHPYWNAFYTVRLEPVSLAV